MGKPLQYLANGHTYRGKPDGDPADLPAGYYRAFSEMTGPGFVPFVEDYIAACEEHPDAEVRVSR